MQVIYEINKFFLKKKVIIAANGVYGLNFEHSLAEALPFVNLGDYVATYITKTNQSIQLLQPQASRFKELVFNIPSEIQTLIKETKAEFFK